MKRIVRILLSCFVLMLLLGVISVAAADAVVTGELVTAAPGKSIEYRVSIQNNPGIVGYNLRLRFDTDVFSLVCDEESGDVLCEQGDFSSAGNLVCAATSDGCQILWSHAKNVTTEGTLFVLKLQIKEGAALGEHPVRIENISRNTVNANEECVPLACVDGAITVRAFRPLITGETKTVRQGEEFEYAVSLADNPGIASYGVVVQFDSTALSLVTNAVTGECITTSSEVFKNSNVVSKTYQNAVEVFCYTTADSCEEGTLFTVRLKAAEDAALGPAAITVQCVADNMQNIDGQTVAFDSESGSVVIQTCVDADITFANGTVTAAVANAKQKNVLVAVYNAAGKMVARAMRWNVTEEQIVLPCADGVRCKVLILNERYQPVCPAFVSP